MVSFCDFSTDLSKCCSGKDCRWHCSLGNLARRQRGGWCLTPHSGAAIVLKLKQMGLSKNKVLTNPIYGLSSFSRSWGSWGVYAIFRHTQTLLLICSGLQKGKLPLPLLPWCFNGLSFFAWIRAISGDYGMQHQEVPFGVPKLVLFWHADVRCKNLYRLSLCRRRCHLPASRSSQLRVVCWRRSIPGYRTSWWMDDNGDDGDDNLSTMCNTINPDTPGRTCCF